MNLLRFQSNYHLGFIVLVALALALSVAVTLTYPVPVGWDWHWHRQVAEVWANGGNGMFSKLVMDTNGTPYPPLFHWLLVPSVWFGTEFAFSRILQLFFYPLGLFTSMFLCWKRSWEEALWCGLLLISSMAYFDHLIQVIPQAVDMIVFPLVLLAYVKKKTKSYIAGSCLLVYNHGLAACSLIGGMLIHSLLERRWENVIPVAYFTLPVTVTSLMWMPTAFQNWIHTTDTTPERMFWENPSGFTLWYMGILTIGFAVAVYKLYKWKTQDTLNKVSILTVLSLLFMFVLWQDRFFTYACMPLAYLTANYVKKLENWKVKTLLFNIILFNALLYYFDHWVMVFYKGYSVRLPETFTA